MSRPRVVHLPVYPENPYQPMLMEAQRALGWDVIDGGGGGNFLRTALKEWRPSVLHLHWLHPYMLRESLSGSYLRGVRFLVEISLIRQRGTAVVWTIHNLANHDGILPGTELQLTRRFVKRCDAIVTHGTAATTIATRRYSIPSSIPVLEIPHPGFVEAYPNTATSVMSRKSLGLSEDDFVFLFLGRIEPYKQLEELIASFSTIEDANAKLVIAGRSSDTAYADQIASCAKSNDRIRFENRFVESSAIQQYMAASNVVVCPSRPILTSGSVALAMSFGRPVVAPSEGCIPESVGSTGVLYDARDSNGLRSALEECIDRRNELAEMGSDAFRRMEEASPKNIATQLLALYDSVIA